MQIVQRAPSDGDYAILFVRGNRLMKKVTPALLALAACAFAASAFAGAVPPTQVPEPGTLALLAAGVAGVVALRLRKRK